VSAAAVAVQQIYDRKPACLIREVARRQIDGRVAIGRVGLEVALERLAVNGDALDLPDSRARGCGRWRSAALAGRLHREAGDERPR
jgi:hypothetical protein